MSRFKSKRDLLTDLRDHLDKVTMFTQAGRAAFDDDEMAQFAVIRVYEVVGEIVKRLPADLRDANVQIDWRKLAGFRDFLAHNYDEIILDFIWEAIEDVPSLRAHVEGVLASLPLEDDI